MTKKPVWKKNIDPAFAYLIRIFRDFLDNACLPRNSGYVSLSDNSLKFLGEKSYPTISRQYGLDFKTALKALDETIRLGANPDIRLIRNLPFKIDETLMQIITALPEGSRAYYLKKFNPDPKWLNALSPQKEGKFL